MRFMAANGRRHGFTCSAQAAVGSRRTVLLLPPPPLLLLVGIRVNFHFNTKNYFQDILQRNDKHD